jgi:hypothetical protein
MLIALLSALCLVQSGASAGSPNLGLKGPQSSGSLKIVSAIYGGPGQTSDITERVKPAVRGDTLWFHVGATETGPDPAPNVFKTLTITYSYEGKTQVASAQDTQSLGIGHLPGPVGQKGAIHIIRAEYGPLDRPAEIRDVAGRLAAAVKGDSLRLVVGSDALGGKPGTSALNWLRVLYTHRGLVKTTTVPEGWILAIGDVPPSRAADSVLRIVKAEFSAQGLSRDVTALVYLAVAGGGLRMVARKDVLDDGATPGVSKALTVDYIYREQPGSITVAENEVLELGDVPRRPPQVAVAPSLDAETGIRILRADYGATNHKTKRLDVTEKLAAMITDEGLQLHVAAAEFTDPAPGAPKSLRVTYVNRGRLETVTVPENKDLAIGRMAVPKAQRSDTLKGMSAGPLHIMSADYGVLDDPLRSVDLTDRVASLVTGGLLSMGLVELYSETAPGVLKNLRVLYVYQGRIGIAIKNDTERVEIGGGGAP